MTKKQFLDAVNEIDDEFINELIDVPSSGNYFADDKPQVVYLEKRRIPFWKIAASTAVAVCILAVGIFASARLREIQTYEPNDSISESSSDIRSETSRVPDKLSAVLTDGYDFSYLTPNMPFRSDTVEKNDDENYAVVYVYCRNVSEENPLFIAVKTYRNNNPVYLGTLYVTDYSAQTYRIDYTEEVKRGDKLFLYISTKSDEVVRADGKWLP